jgi:hypothetical protein
MMQFVSSRLHWLVAATSLLANRNSAHYKALNLKSGVEALIFPAGQVKGGGGCIVLDQEGQVG